MTDSLVPKTTTRGRIPGIWCELSSLRRSNDAFVCWWFVDRYGRKDPEVYPPEAYKSVKRWKADCTAFVALAGLVSSDHLLFVRENDGDAWVAFVSPSYVPADFTE